MIMTSAITAKMMVGMVRNEPMTKMPVRAEIMPKTSAVTAAHFFFFGASTGAPYAGCTVGACWVNYGYCGATGCGVFSDMKVLISYVVGDSIGVTPPRVGWHFLRIP